MPSDENKMTNLIGGLGLELGESLKIKISSQQPAPVIQKGSLIESLDLNTGYNAFKQYDLESSPVQKF